jgi:hypothetical protein
MGKLDRIYRRTEMGRKALHDGDAQLSPEHQRILGLLECDTHSDEIRKVLRRRADFQRLFELEAEGYVSSIAAEPESDLDFTGLAFGS